jgi:cystathionine gamma-synthase/cystathionine gamma-lyase
MKFQTKAIHVGQEPDPGTGAVVTPVYQTSTYRLKALGKPQAYDYSRAGNPTRRALETVLASLEGGKYGLAYASGVAATASVFNLLQKGDHVLAGEDLYGGSIRLLEKVFKKWGLEVDYAGFEPLASFEKAIRPNTKLVWIETPSNPLLRIIDIRQVVRVCAKRRILLAVDNTFATPCFQKPLALGADVVVHSTTKYIGGHSDVVGGAVVVNNRKVYEGLKFHQNAAGAIPGPWDCWLALRGIKTLALRMRAHEENALALAKFLSKHPGVERVHYPGLKTHPGYSVAKKQMTGFGGMICVELKGGYPAVRKFLSRLKLFSLAGSLGGVESLANYPSGMIYNILSRGERLRRGIRDNLVRLSVGIEDKEDLIEDLAHALAGRPRK